MKYQVTIDFGDNSIRQPPKVCENLTDLALYLERIPSMIGFEIYRRATVKIITIFPGSHQGRPSN